ncbi:MAG TPA: ATP-binding protein, partial [Phycisphaerae bacterium]|nr:ATP-binding protein [Phycisphaerae bacterium]
PVDPPVPSGSCIAIAEGYPQHPGLEHGVGHDTAAEELGQHEAAPVRPDPDEELVAVAGDVDQLTQVFTNLLENALKYGASGGIVTVTVSDIGRDPALRASVIRVDVTDRGEGFDPVHIPRLTERFYRIDGHRSRAEGGTGLGLAIVKHIVGRHRGRLSIESAPGKCARFSVILPQAEDARGEAG